MSDQRTICRRCFVLAVASALMLPGCSGENTEPVPGDQSFVEKALPSGEAGRPLPGPRPQAAKPPEGLVLPVFEELTPESGFVFERFDDIQGQRRIIETNGGGVGLLDFDADGLLDVFMMNGCRLPVSQDDHSTPSVLFRNLGDWQFERVSESSRVRQFGFACGAAVGDVNSDGFDDLYVTAFGSNALWANNGDGTFSDITEETGTAVPVWSSSAAFADVNLDGNLDLYVANYLAESDESPRLCPNAASPTGYEGCSPALFDGVDDVLFLSDGAGGMEDVSANCGLAGLKGKGLGVVVTDFDDDSVPEIYVANDGEANFLLCSNVSLSVENGEASVGRLPDASSEASFRLSDEAVSSAIALNELGFAQASMGIAAGDYDGDGSTDLFLTHFYGDTNTLYRNAGQLTFSDETRSSRVGAPGRQTLGFGTVLMDANLDGWLDLFIANGHVDDRTWMPEPQPYRMPAQLLLNQHDGAFAEVSAWSGNYFAEQWIGRGVAVGDLDNDHKPDLVISHQLAPSVILRNETKSDQGSYAVRLVGTVSNRNAIGAKLTLRVAGTSFHRVISGGGSFQSALSTIQVFHTGEQFFHTGEKSGATLEVAWPDGRRQFAELEPDSLTILVEQASIDR